MTALFGYAEARPGLNKCNPGCNEVRPNMLNDQAALLSASMQIEFEILGWQ